MNREGSGGPAEGQALLRVFGASMPEVSKFHEVALIFMFHLMSL